MMFINLQHIFVSIDGVGEGSEDKFRRGRNRNGLGFHLKQLMIYQMDNITSTPSY